MHAVPLPIVLALLPVVFFTGAFAFRRNPLLGAKTLDELEGWYHQAQAKLQARRK